MDQSKRRNVVIPEISDPHNEEKISRPTSSPHASRSYFRWPWHLLRIACWIPAISLVWKNHPYVVELAAMAAPLFALGLTLVGLFSYFLNRRLAAVELWVCCLVTFSLCSWSARPYRHSNYATAYRERLRVLTYNALGQRSTNDEQFYEWFRERDPDLVCIIEPPANLLQQRAWIRERYPFHLEPSPGLQWEIVLLSKRPFKITPLAPYSAKVAFSFPANRSVRLALDSGGTVLFTAMHPPSPRKASTEQFALDSVRLDGEVIANWLREHQDLAIVGGDFNSPPTGRVFRTFAESSGLQTWTNGLQHGTWPSWAPTWSSFPIDRIWVSPTIVIRSVEVGPRFASDHRPVFADLRIPFENSLVQRENEAPAEPTYK